MLPAPPMSCAGWWFTQLWRVLLSARPARHALWTLAYPEPGEVRARPGEGGPALERISGSLQLGTERRCAVTWDWPGEDGMLHTLQALWQPGELVVRPLEWSRRRRPFPTLDAQVGQAPWPLRVPIAVRGWHGQLLEHAEIVAVDEERSYPLQWGPPRGEPRLPVTDLPCTLTGPEREQPESGPTVTLAGLTLPWRIDLDRECWVLWRRFSATALLERLGGAEGACPRHGYGCPWPATGRVR
ncbi:MAG TPA: hypothetical protein VHB98_15440 [Chloroflexota bacterium]|nr:hypothetical protein [Chloroflexota bacterium]